MLSDDRFNALQRYLGRLPAEALMRLAMVVELDELSGGVLPHDEILEMLRPATQGSQQRPRTPTPIRYFCLPFEDLLFDGVAREKRRGAIARAAIVPVWSWLTQLLLPEEARIYADAFNALALADETDKLEDCAAGFWQIAADAMKDALAADRDAAAKALGGDAFAAEAEEMALLLAAGPQMMQIRALFPAPAGEPGEDRISRFRAVYEAAIRDAPDAAQYLPVVAMARLEKPWQALRLVLVLSRLRNDTLIAATDMGLVGDILLARMDEDREFICTARHPDFDANRLLDRLADFTLLSNAITREVDVLRCGKWGKQLIVGRTAVGAAMEAFMAHAPKQIAEVLPMKRSRASVYPMIADLSAFTEDKAKTRALRHARLLAGCKYLATAANFAAAQQAAMKAACDHLCFYNEVVVGQIYAAREAAEANLDRQLALAIALTRILLSTDEAEQLSRRFELAGAA
jgi:hypothetical protein